MSPPCGVSCSLTRHKSINLHSSKYWRAGHRPWDVCDESRGKNCNARDGGDSCYNSASCELDQLWSWTRFSREQPWKIETVCPSGAPAGLFTLEQNVSRWGKGKVDTPSEAPGSRRSLEHNPLCVQASLSPLRTSLRELVHMVVSLQGG